MSAQSTLRATFVAITAILLFAPAAVADTCCANLPVGLDRVSAMPGDTVTLSGIQCRYPDNSGPRPLKLGAFWLAMGERAAIDPGDVPGDPNAGPGPADFPPVEEWLPFESLPEPTATSGDATITVPKLPDGIYQLWWWCDQDGPGGGIHYSSGPRLAIGAVPDTATEAPGPEIPSDSFDWRMALALGLAVAVVALAFDRRRAAHRLRSEGGA